MFRMFELTVLLLASLLYPTPVLAQMNAARPLVRSYALPADIKEPPTRSTSVFQTSQPRDSLKNGAIIGAIIGAATGAVIAGVGCAIVEQLEGETPGDESCVGFAVYLVGAGTVIGAGIGVGLDALFERGASAALPAGGRRTVLRLRFEF